MKIAIIGSGLAGLATASFLKRDGHDVTVFERDTELKGKGFGIQIQPLGVAVLKQLGLEEKLVASGARINRAFAEMEKKNKNKTIMDVHYKDMEPGAFAVGIHRPRLYDILLDKARALGVNFVTGCSIEDAVLKGEQRQLLDAAGKDRGSFDLVVDASGYKSPLRKTYATITRSNGYPYTVICGTVEYNNKLRDAFRDAASYHYREATHSMTLIPAGKDAASGKDQVSFFWMMPEREFNTFDLDKWKKQVTDALPSMQPYVDQVTSRNQLVFVRYADVTLKTYNTDRMVFVGDSAHATSPLLGQSTSMAFTDALVLSKILQREPDLKKALETYSAERKEHIKYQQDNSRLLTHIFQSVSPPVKFYRDVIFPKILKLPGMRVRTTTQSARAEASLKNSPLRKKYGI